MSEQPTFITAAEWIAKHRATEQPVSEREEPPC